MLHLNSRPVEHPTRVRDGAQLDLGLMALHPLRDADFGCDAATTNILVLLDIAGCLPIPPICARESGTNKAIKGPWASSSVAPAVP